jgi:hypothetical protein
MAEGNHLRVGVVLDGRDVRQWHATAIEQIERLGFCEVIAFAGPSRARRRRGLVDAARHALYTAYVWADRRVFGGESDAIDSVPLDRPRRPLREIGSHDLDVVLCLSPEVTAAELAGAARYGAWSLHAGGMRGRAVEAQLFWQMYDADFVAPITLRAHTREGGERVIYRSIVHSDQVSLHRSRCRAAQRGAHLPARRLRDLRHRGWEGIPSSPPEPEEARDRPTNAMMLRLIWRVARGVVARRVSGWAGETQWFIAYRRGSSPPTTIMPPPGRFYADPFLFQHKGRRFIFFEDYDWTTERAVICYVELHDQGRHGEPKVALRQDCHLSYPFVFAEGDEVYMLPETAGHRRVELFRASRFPEEWTLERVLLEDVKATDATLVRHDGRLWLFVAMAVDGGRAVDELFLFSSDSLEGEWRPHPMNPVVSDVRSARPAGRIFKQGGHLIRPSQDCSQAYGGRLVFNRIVALTPTEYREEPISAIEPLPDTGNLRTHSYDFDDAYEVLDGYRVRPRVRVGGSRRAPQAPGWDRVDLEA